jgi:hypothetical protein
MIQPLFIAFTGGLMYDLMILYKDYQLPKDKRVEKDLWYWLFMSLWPLSGVLLIYIYKVDGSVINGFPAFMTGFTASTTFQTMLNKSFEHSQIDDSQIEDI